MSRTIKIKLTPEELIKTIKEMKKRTGSLFRGPSCSNLT